MNREILVAVELYFFMWTGHVLYEVDPLARRELLSPYRLAHADAVT